MAGPKTFAVLGATSLVGAPLLEQLAATPHRVIAYSRTARPNATGEWRILGVASPEPADCWLSVAPIWTLPELFSLIEASGAKRLVQLSSTSQFTKASSADPHEAEIARRLSEGEAELTGWAATHGIAWTILRPTLIYGAGRDKNVAEIARVIDRFGFFPLFGTAAGLRQPVAAEDVARACLLAAEVEATGDRAYNIGGGEVLSYREMVLRIFEAEGRRPIIPTIPMAAFRMALATLHLVPRYRHWTAGMAERMNIDMVFDNGPAARDFGYAPKWFEPARLGQSRVRPS